MQLNINRKKMDPDLNLGSFKNFTLKLFTDLNIKCKTKKHVKDIEDCWDLRLGKA
jgi:hypothetical protein